MKKEKNNSLIIKIIKDEVGVYIPSDYKIKKWSKLAFQNIKKSIVTIKLAKQNEITNLNKIYFNKNKSCNVLSFPNNSYSESGSYILGDIIICPDVVKSESILYNKDIDSRWAHMIIHAMLHMQGYTHDFKKDQISMEKKEREIMNFLGYPDPYYAN